MFIYTAILGAVILEYVAGQVSVNISDTNLAGVAGQDVPVSCFYTVGISVNLVSNGSVMAPNFTREFANGTQINYILRNVSRQNNNAQFYCRYFDINMPVTSAIATLSVWYLYPVPQFNLVAMLQKTVFQPLYLAVNVTANPAPTMAWYRDNVLLTNGTVPLNGDTGVASYSIASLVFSNAGNYTVVISNTAGSMTYSVMVMVDAATVPPVTPVPSIPPTKSNNAVVASSAVFLTFLLSIVAAGTIFHL